MAESGQKGKGPEASPRLGRLRTWHLVLMVLIAGWVPSLLMAFLAYSYLSQAFEERISVSTLEVVRALAKLVEVDIGRTAEVMEYYQTLPRTQEMLAQPPSETTQQWLASMYYAHPRIDGMFLTDSEGRMIASLPDTPEIGEAFDTEAWLHQSSELPGAYVSAVFPRKPDGRMNSVVVVAVRDRDQKIVGYLGASVLVERIGRRIGAVGLTKGGATQLFDQNGFPLFERDFSPSPYRTPVTDEALAKRFYEDASGVFEHGKYLFTYGQLEPFKWVVVFEQPLDAAYRPVRELAARIAFLAAWLVLGTALVATTVARLYRRQIENSDSIERAMLLNENILGNIPVGIAQLDSSSRAIVRANQEFVDLAVACEAISLDGNVIGLTIRDFPFIAESKFNQVVTTGESYSATEQKYQDPKGNAHYYSVNAVRLQDRKGTNQGVLLIVEDQTPSVTLTRKFMEANTSKDQFLAVLSHELRNPLSPVITSVAELEEAHVDDEETRKSLEVIRRNVELEARLIDDLLDITRIVNHKLQLQLENTDVHETLHRALEICRRDAEEKQVILNTAFDALEHHVSADPARLQQVFWNLVKNAIKFTPRDKPITLSTANPDPEHIAITFQDEGIGIEPSRLGRIFNAFEQGEQSITRRFGGLGLGLAISRAMVEAHGGEITVHSEGADQGTTFRVILKIVAKPEKVRTPVQPTSDRAALLSGKRVLVVDDHVDTNRGLEMLLKRRGMQVAVAFNASEALKLAEDQTFDAVLSDLGLPDKSGHELMSELHQKYKIPGIALSGFGMENDVQRSYDAGFSKHLIKPVNIGDLTEALQDLFADQPAGVTEA